MKNQYLADFLQTHSIEDVQQTIVGELNEHSTELATYLFGNSELIVLPREEHIDEIVFVVDIYGNKPVFSQL